MAKWADTPKIDERTWDEREARIADLEAILDLRNAASRSLCIAVHGREIEGKSIYDLIVDADQLRQRAMQMRAAQITSQKPATSPQHTHHTQPTDLT